MEEDLQSLGEFFRDCVSLNFFKFSFDSKSLDWEFS